MLSLSNRPFTSAQSKPDGRSLSRKRLSEIAKAGRYFVYDPSHRQSSSMKYGLIALVCLLSATSIWAQPAITGTVTDEGTGDPVPGASVVLAGTTMGASTDASGRYELYGTPPGTYTLIVHFIGYNEASRVITIRGSKLREDFAIEFTSVALKSMEVFSSRALERSTPVAFSTFVRARVQRELGSRDVPLVLNSTPSVYSTVQGGGAGDARVNVRGFNQRNVAIMINGIPVNDMENGWLYWSNWDGLGEVTNSIQLQRGLSVVNLATPSIGGSMNILTDPARNDRQVLFKQEFGNDGLRKSTVMLSSGLMRGKVAVTVSGVRKTGRGYVHGTWTDMWSYFAAAGWNVNSRHRVDVFAIGAPQRHGQNLFKQNIAAYDHAYARKIFERDGLSEFTIQDILRTYPAAGRRWNQNVGAVSPAYTSMQHNGFGTVRRKNAGYVDEIENFFHKPIVSLSHFGQLSERSLLSTVVYYSGGKGGGSGRHGDLLPDTSGPSPVPDYDATIAANRRNGLSLGIIRNRHNVQWTVGGISKFIHEFSEHLRLEVGLDWRSAEIQHFSTVRDLLGGIGYLRFDSDYWGASGRILAPGDRFDYNDITTVSWLGGFAQGQFQRGPLAGFAVVGYSGIRYTFEDFFSDDGGRPFRVTPDPIRGYQVKGGATYSLAGGLSVFASAGQVSKVPVFDGVVDAISGSVNPDPQNETFLGLEAGGTFQSDDRRLNVKLGLYHTTWNDRTVTRNLVEQSGNDELVNIRGLNARHMGLEGELAYQPYDFVRADAAFSFGDWRYTDDVFGTYTPDRSDPRSQTQVSLYLKDVKVGDAPQLQLAYSLTAFAGKSLHVTLTGRSYAQHYADFDPAGQSSPGGRVWKAPPYTVIDLQGGYHFEMGRMGVRAFIHVFNVLNTFYVQDATNNSRFYAYVGNGTGMGTSDDAAVFLGLPRTFNLGTRVTLR